MGMANTDDDMIEVDADGKVAKKDFLKRLGAKNSQIEALQTELETLKAKSSDTKDDWKSKYEALNTEYEAFKAETEMKSSLLGAGITDPEDQDMVMTRWNKLGDKKPKLSDYVGDKGAAREDRYLAGIFGKGAANVDGKTSETKAEEPAKRAVNPAAKPGVSQDNASTGGTRFTPDALKGMSTEDKKKNLDSIMNDLGGGKW